MSNSNSNLHAVPNRGIALTRITATNPRILTKQFKVGTNGKLVKTSSAQLTEGTAELVTVPSLREFADLLDGLKVSQALAFGVTPEATARLVSEKRLESAPGAISRTRKFFGFRRAPGIFMLDHDSDADHALEPEALIEVLRGLAPCLASAPMLWRPSASSGIQCTTDDSKAGITGQRIYIPVRDAALIPEAGKALMALLWSSGHGRIEIGRAGQALERGLVDASVWQPERLDFAAPPILGEGVERKAPRWFIDGDTKGMLDLRDLIAAADGTIKTQATNARRSAREAIKPQLKSAREEWVETEAPKIAEKHGIAVEAIRAALTRASEKRELTGDFVLHCDDGSTPTVGQLLDNPQKWHGKRFGDPLEPDYGSDRRIAWANLRSGGRPYIYSHAHGGRRFPLLRPSARIELKRGDRARVVDQVLDLLRARGDLYDHGDGASLARVTEDARTLPVNRDWLVDHFDRIAEFYVLVAGPEPDAPPDEEPQDAPAWAAMRIVAKDGERGLPQLDAVITAPTLRADGSILAEPGYDAASKLLLMSDTPDLPAVPVAPTMEQARTALDALWHPFRLFPLVDEVDAGVVLSMLLTAVVRASLPTAPGIALDAPSAGTGKTLLAQAIAALSLGYTPPVLPPAGSQDDEARKRLFAALRDGHRVILWDNVRDGLGNAALDAFLTSATYSDRILGSSQTATLPNRCLFLTTGNNLRLIGDTCRRIFPARLDARIEKPYAREFDFCPLEQVLSRRMELVSAALTIMRAWITTGRVRHGAGRTASFEVWDDLVRQTVCWVGTWDKRFADPLTATERAFALDPETAKLSALLSAWDAVIGTKPTTTAALITATEHSEFAPEDDARPALDDAVREIADQRGVINPRILGRWIERHVDRRHDGRRIIRGTVSRGRQQWALVRDADESVKPQAAEKVRASL
ncbi:ATP-binding protein [Halochromatium roseum]|uniref:ATP-binding protein n=1 Tax=Halochromatium roseum TaxID=391920 RepID=UPI00191468B7|nr:ATP-binding protein [Halochromatium roseum]MBK5941429.1 hypothetical protein [Halochromatium roseum]